MAWSLQGCERSPETEASSRSRTGPHAMQRGGEQGSDEASGSSPLPLSRGQWVQYRITLSDGRTSEQRFVVLEKEKDAHWIETVQDAANAGTVTQLLILPKSAKRTEPVLIRRARIKMPNGLVKTLEGAALEISEPGYRKTLDPFVLPELRSLTPTDITVVAGTFRGALSGNTRATVLGTELEAKVTYHSAVPITALIQLESRSAATKMELIAYGTTGGVSAMKR